VFTGIILCYSVILGTIMILW